MNSAERSRKFRAKKHPDYARNASLWTNYRITLDQYDNWNDGFCHSCGDKVIKPVVDHNHQTELVRGLLCNPCNKGLGHFKDNIERLKKAIAYLEDAQQTQEYTDNAFNEINK